MYHCALSDCRRRPITHSAAVRIEARSANEGIAATVHVVDEREQFLHRRRIGLFETATCFEYEIGDGLVGRFVVIGADCRGALRYGDRVQFVDGKVVSVEIEGTLFELHQCRSLYLLPEQRRPDADGSESTDAHCWDRRGDEFAGRIARDLADGDELCAAEPDSERPAV